jgi:glyoxylase-like metal-dependent hydrolase (beta-lactamase superfamily II)/ferredoxin
MANVERILPENVPGEFFVDSTCIDCDTCRQLAPQVFGETNDSAYVRQQPLDGESERAALHALVSCPTGSIGTRGPNRAKEVMADFPLRIDGNVYYCGFTSPKSFGGSSYFIQHAAGNWLVDSPKFLPQLVRRLEASGGLRHIFLTHQDDVADAERYARHFGAERIIHRAELHAQPNAEQVLDGDDAIELAPGFVAILTSGHTAGHLVLLHDERFLFTGDHLAWDRHLQRLTAFRDYCWYSWPRQCESMARLLNYRFEWVLPGHGERVHLPPDQMRRELAELVQRMGSTMAHI